MYCEVMTKAPHHDHNHEHKNRLVGALRSIFMPHCHGTAESIDDALEASRAGIRAVKVSLLALGVTALAQLAVVYFTGSVALLADTIHNFSDGLTAIPLWIAFSLARRVPTRRYTYGYGRAEDLAGMFIVAMIALSALVAGFESIRRLAEPRELDYVWAVAAAGLIGFIGNELVALYRIRVGSAIGSAALVADGLHARTDGLTSLAVLLGALGVLLGFPLADPIVGLAITVAILFVLKSAAIDVCRRLMDAVDPAIPAQVEAAARLSESVVVVDNVRVRWSGHRLRAEVDIWANDDLTFSEAHTVAGAVEFNVSHRVPKLSEVHVHIGPIHQRETRDHGG